MTIKYREYKEEDREICEILLAQLISELSSKNRFRRRTPAKEYGENYLHTFLVDPDSMIYVAIEAETQTIIGIVVGRIESPSKTDLLEYKPYTAGHITDLYVEKDYRRYGIGQKLLKKLERFFMKKDCDFVEIEVLASNIPAYKLYQSLDFQDYFINLRKIYHSEE